MADPDVGADVEIYEPVRAGRSEPPIVRPWRVRVNGVDVGLLAKDGLVVDAGEGGKRDATVTLTLLPRTVWIGAEIEATD